MNLPDRYIQDLVDCLTRSGFGFALYRLPWTDECYFIAQLSGEVEQMADIHNLNGKKGFVMAPFQRSEKHPLVVIRPDITACGWSEIREALFLMDCKAAVQTCCDVRDGTCPSEVKTVEKKQYTKAFEHFITPLREKCFQKLVLSRSAMKHISADFSPLGTFVHACNSYPRMMIYLCHTPKSGTWMGSTPEILLSGYGKRWHTVALAGTMPVKDEVMPMEWNRKNREEQSYVADYVRQIVLKFGDEVTEEGPYTARAGQLVHLKTDFHFLLNDIHQLGDLLQELHPTPAVCGLPKEDAFRFILKNEGYDRSYYSGFIGWLDPEGHTDLYVNLRCMEIISNAAVLYAGGGILPLSEVESEWEETGEKMKTMSNILSI
ncbi:isochorismate synthase [Bacteroides helcogenes]|uniref:isochorismate synthase n=1 Tax=Bacteroides helcogenes (strain ATCC 35417 / DSM 20613 / JCM 6297 / CCUG 15421 / P 36-108) TaxID=693979 RepID=E6SX01_BACT6|nr:isochorismate synthase [Bacteroides helcogenes]ADV44689.1 isochorismate synthase [Bacteroides helcogenes P 36-108]MDY5238547.1 isochorismate synthase [Bacteroides helcogenes]